MIPVYICDDQQIFQQKIREIVDKYIFIEDNTYEIKLVTAEPKALLTSVAEKIQRGVYFLDVELIGSEYDGFKLAQEIRKLDTRGFIIFITSHHELAFETFKYRVEAMDYIVKDDATHLQQRIYDCMRSVSKRMLEEREVSLDFFAVKIGSETQHLPYQDILFFETSTQKHRIIVHTETLQLEFFANLQDIEEQLPSYFLRTHRSYLVNTSKISTINYKTNEIVLVNEQVCLLSRKLKNELKSIIK